MTRCLFARRSPPFCPLPFKKASGESLILGVPRRRPHADRALVPGGSFPKAEHSQLCGEARTGRFARWWSVLPWFRLPLFYPFFFLFSAHYFRFLASFHFHSCCASSLKEKARKKKRRSAFINQDGRGKLSLPLLLLRHLYG